MAVGDVYRFSMIGDWEGAYVGVTTLHARMKSGAGTPQGFCAALTTNLVSLLKGYQNNIWYWRQINFLSENLTPPVSGNYTTGYPIQGVASGDSLPYTAAGVWSWRTAYAGRSYRGRSYIPEIPEAHQNKGVLSSTLLNAWTNYANDLLAAYGSGGSSADYELGVWSQKLSTFTIFNDVLIRSLLGTQRRRRQGTGA